MIRGHHHQRVAQDIALLQVGHQPADFVVGISDLAIVQRKEVSEVFRHHLIGAKFLEILEVAGHVAGIRVGLEDLQDIWRRHVVPMRVVEVQSWRTFIESNPSSTPGFSRRRDPT